MTSPRYSTRVRSIALGGRDPEGRQRYATPLELEREPAFEPATQLIVDWDLVAEICGFDLNERRFFLRRWKDGIHSWQELGLDDSYQAGILTRTITRRLGECRERLRHCFIVANDSEKNIQKTFARSRFEASLANTCRETQVEVDQLTTKLGEANQVRARILERLIAFKAAARQAENECDQLLVAARKAAVENLIADRKPTTAADEKKLETARNKAAAARESVSIAEEALQQQDGAINGLAGQIAQARHQIIEAKFEKPRDRIEVALRDLGSAMSEVIAISEAHAPVSDFYGILFPINDKNPLTNYDATRTKIDACMYAARWFEAIRGRAV